MKRQVKNWMNATKKNKKNPQTKTSMLPRISMKVLLAATLLDRITPLEGDLEFGNKADAWGKRFFLAQ